jgi:hypothetical protein
MTNKTKTTKTTKLNVNVEKRNNHSYRYVILNRCKYGFVSDLVKIYGSSFLQLLDKQPSSLRIEHNGNSQERRLVRIPEFRDTIKNFGIAPKSDRKAKNKKSSN